MGASSNSCSFPQGHDPDTLVAAEGAESFEARLKEALPLSEYLVRQLASQVQTADVGGRAKLAALAAPLFSRMPEGVYRDLTLERLAAEVRMPAAKLREHLDSAVSRARHGHRKTGRPGGRRRAARFGPRGTNPAQPRSDKRGPRNAVEPGDQPGAAPPRGGARGRCAPRRWQASISPASACSTSCSTRRPNGPADYRDAARAVAGPARIPPSDANSRWRRPWWRKRRGGQRAADGDPQAGRAPRPRPPDERIVAKSGGYGLELR